MLSCLVAEVALAAPLIVKDSLWRDVGFVVCCKAICRHAISRKKNQMINDEVGQSCRASDGRSDLMDLSKIPNLKAVCSFLADVQHLQMPWLRNNRHAEEEADGATKSKENDD